MMLAHEKDVHRTDGRRAVLSHLESLSQLGEDDRALVATALGPLTEFRPNHVLIEQDALLDEPVFMASGWACRLKTLSDGRRQVIDFYIPGDLVGYSPIPAARAKASYVCLTHVTTVSAKDLVHHIRHEPGRYVHLATALTQIEEEIEDFLAHQIVRAGAMLAHERMMHWIWEMERRHRRAGISREGFSMPLTQETLGEALGLSTVHVNRVLQQLRRENIIRTPAGRIEIVDPALLAEQLGVDR